MDQPTPDQIDAAIIDDIPPPNRIMAPVKWYGGKGRIATKIVSHIPKSGVYVEPYAGAASVFWHLPAPRPIEVLNDLHVELVTLFRVLQDTEKFRELTHRLLWTPYSLDEFRKALSWKDPRGLTDIDRAWALFVRKNQGFSGHGDRTDGNWGRAFTARSRGMADSCATWNARLASLRAWHERLLRVQLDCRDALEIISYWDSADTVFYVDPPYVGSTRTSDNRNMYRHEATDEHHTRLIDVLLSITGQAVLSGYHHELYRRLDADGWHQMEIRTVCHSAGRGRGSSIRGKGNALKQVPRTEVLWIKDWITEGGRRRVAERTLFDRERETDE